MDNNAPKAAPKAKREFVTLVLVHPNGSVDTVLCAPDMVAHWESQGFTVRPPKTLNEIEE